jgi:hypothetical protein
MEWRERGPFCSPNFFGRTSTECNSCESRISYMMIICSMETPNYIIYTFISSVCMPVRLLQETGQQQPSEHPTPASERLAARTPHPNGIPTYRFLAYKPTAHRTPLRKSHFCWTKNDRLQELNSLRFLLGRRRFFRIIFRKLRISQRIDHGQ